MFYSPYVRSGWLRGPSEWKGTLNVVQGNKPMNPIPVISGVTCCCGPGRFSELCSTALLCEWHYDADHAWKGLWHPVGTLSPLVQYYVLICPLAIVSKDQGMSITF